MGRAAIRLMAIAMLALLPGLANADDDVMVFGQDTYATGQTTTLDVASPRSAFVSGFTASLDGPVTKDAHIAGGHVSVDAPVSGDLYAAGAWVSIDDAVGGDISASGYSVSLDKNAAVGGNTRIAARSIEIDAPLSGSFLAVAGTLTINTVITGDVMLTVNKLTFGPDAKIDGNLVYVGPQSIEIPESVIPADRVTHQKIAGAALSSLAQFTAAGQTLHDIRENGALKTAAEVAGGKEAATLAVDEMRGGHSQGFWALLAGFLISLIAYLVIAAIFFAYVPGRTETVRARLVEKPFASLGYGFVSLSMLIGSIPVAAMTIIGIVFIPFLALFAFAACMLAYLVAAYALSWWALSSIKPLTPSLINKLLATAAGIVLLSLTHYLWFFGWIINIAVVLIGLGAMTALCGHTMLAKRAEKKEAEEPASIATAPQTDTPEEPKTP